jgi:hypothetical protein
MTRVLVCGGRNYSDSIQLSTVLCQIDAERAFTALIHGGASGADRIASIWARDGGIPVESYPAEWGKFGYAAGPKRNRQMLQEGKPDLVIAFPGGKGTANMVAQARAAGVKVIEVR